SLSVDGRYPFVHDIVGNTICADLIDYLQRDHLHTGLPIALGSRFINGAQVLTADHPTHPHRMAVRVSRNAQLRHDVLTEILKYLRYRYELSERVLYHHTKLAADAMLAKLFASWVEALTHGDNGGTATRPSAKALRMVEDSLLTNSDD